MVGWAGTTSRSRLRGPAVADVGAPPGAALAAVDGRALVERCAGGGGERGDVELQVVRTVPEKLYGFRRAATFGSLRRTCGRSCARELVYLENQFLWSPEIVNILADKLRRPPIEQVSAS